MAASYTYGREGQESKAGFVAILPALRHSRVMRYSWACSCFNAIVFKTVVRWGR